MTRLFAIIACLGLAPRFACAGQPVDYVTQIKPLLAARCYSCHSALRQKSGLRLDTAALLVEGGDGGPAIEPGHADKSLLIDVLTGELGLRMPPESEGAALTADEIGLLRQWIDQGARAPEETPQPDPRDHWAYHPPQRPTPPAVKNASWVRNTIDAFLAAEHESHGLTPNPPADKAVLLRRVYLDLTGLPPTRDELLAFESADSPQAYEAVVDRLLSSPQYGERWARHWMDVWRYSDWAGYQQEIRYSQRHIWRWRDWIVESLNADKGYDRMVVEMLAGDEAAPTDPDTLRATGFLARNWFKFNRNVWLDSTIEHTAKALLGVTMNCCKCHDHKYDPIDQSDYFAMRAIFEPHDVRTDRVPGEPDVTIDGVARVCDMRPDDPTYLLIRGDEKQPDKDQVVAASVPAALGETLDVKPVDLPVTAWYPALRDDLAAADLARAAQTVVQLEAAHKQAEGEKNAAATQLSAANLAAARAAQASLAARVAAEKAKYGLERGADADALARAAARAEKEHAVCAADVQRIVAQQELIAAKAAVDASKPETGKKFGDATAALAKSAANVAAARFSLLTPTSTYSPLGEQYPQQSTGRRLAFARWIANRRNPLAARVAVNHIWLRHFGAPLVDNMFDFGLRSPQARHQPLLDWLAVEFMEHGWQLKHIHRLMVTSSAYRMQSGSAAASPANLAADRDNRFLWRMNSRRLEAEAVRDSLFHLAGSLDATRGGPEIDCQLFASTPRRSIYLRHAYEKQAKFLELFDGPSVNECYRRSESVVPQQALALANSDVSLDQSRLLAKKLAALAAQQDGMFIRFAFEQILNRRPSAEELVESEKFLARQTDLLRSPEKLTAFAPDAQSAVSPSIDPPQRARENFVHVLCNHNDFLTIH